MPTLNDAADAIRHLIATTWPEVVANGVYEVETLDQLPWERLTPPYAAFQCSVPEEDDQWGFEPIWFRIRVRVFYMTEVGEAGQRESLKNKVEALIVALIPDTLTTGQVLSTDASDWSDTNPVNEVFTAKSYAHRAGTVDFTLLVCLNGESG